MLEPMRFQATTKNQPTELANLNLAAMTPAPVPTSGHAMQIESLSAWYGSNQAIRNVSLGIQPNAITAIIGPSGCGKSTFIRCLNRMHEVVRGGRVAGKVLLDDANIYAPSVDPVLVRRMIGMVFQK